MKRTFYEWSDANSDVDGATDKFYPLLMAVTPKKI